MKSVAHQESVDNLYVEALGVKRSDLVRKINKIKLMAWEQLLLVSLYARRQYYKDYISFHGRMKFVKVISAKHYEEHEPYLLKCLDSGMSFLTIIQRLNARSNDGKINEFTHRSLLRELESEQVIFTASHEKLHYSYRVLYTALTCFISVSQEMLSLPVSEVLCDRIVTKKLSQLYRSELSLRSLEGLLQTSNQGHHQDEPVTLQDLLQMKVDLPGRDFDVNLLIDTALAESMQSCLFSFFHPSRNAPTAPFNSIYDDNREASDPHWIQQSASPDGGQHNLHLDLTTLSRYLLMGQHEAVGKLLASVLDKVVAKKSRLPQRKRNIESPASAAEWYQQCSVLELTRLDEVPPRIAAILFHDFEKLHIPIILASREINISFKNALSRKEVELLTTWVIRHCLYHTGKPYDFQQQSLFTVNLEWFRDKSATEQDLLADPLLKAWANDTPNRVRTRFKKPLREFTDYFSGAEELVRKQISLAMRVEYPMQTGFPLPLWLPEDHTESQSTANPDADREASPGDLP